MSRIIPITKKCALCNREHEYRELASTNSFGACDLDLRPPEMKRSTMPLWVEQCPFCGYVSSDISKLPIGESKVNQVKEFISKESFKCVEEKAFASKLACKFYKQYMLGREFGNKEQAFYALLHAAWSCDDENDKNNAIICRKTALEFLEFLILNDKDNENLRLQKADLLRRSGDFDAVIQQYNGEKFSNELLNKIVRFQIEKSKLKDDACYTVADV